MNKLFGIMAMGVGVYLAITPLLNGYAVLGIGVDLALAVLTVALGALLFAGKAEKPAATGLVVLGVLTVAWGVCEAIGFLGYRGGSTEILLGAFVAVAGYAPTLFMVEHDGKPRMFNDTGSELALVKKITVKDGELRVKANLLGSMLATIYVRPDELVKTVTMVNFEVIKALPGIILAGKKQLSEGKGKK